MIDTRSDPGAWADALKFSHHLKQTEHVRKALASLPMNDAPLHSPTSTPGAQRNGA